MNPTQWDEQLDSEFFLLPLMDDNEIERKKHFARLHAEKIKTRDWLESNGGDDKSLISACVSAVCKTEVEDQT
jgi:hypothetical protein